MAAYLTTHKPRIQQWYTKRNRSLTGCTVLHTSEGVMDTVGVDTGTTNLADFIRTRTSYGAYHDCADSDSNLQLVEYKYGAYHDGTGSNNWALSISFVCRTVDWNKMSLARRAGFMRQGALAFVRQQKYRASTGAPLTRLRRISRAESNAGASGFIAHGDRDPGRRTDPGTLAPHLFPWNEWFAACRKALAEHMPNHPDAPKGGAVTSDQDVPGAEPKEDPLADPNVVKQIDDLWNALTQPVIVGETLAASQRRLVNTAKASAVELAGLRAAVAELAKQRPGGDGEEIIRRVEEAIARVKVEVSVVDAGLTPK